MTVRERLWIAYIGLRRGEVRAILFSVALAACLVAGMIVFADLRMRLRPFGEGWNCVEHPYGSVCHKDVSPRRP